MKNIPYDLSRIFLGVMIFLLIGYIYPRQGFAGSIESGFYQANAFYENTQYDKAIEEYEKILAYGIESGSIYYNLGNCYFKKAQLGKAILNYEKARRIILGDKDLEFNYDYAKSLIKTNVSADKKNWLVSVIDKIFSKVTIDGGAIFLFVGYLMMMINIILIVCVKAFKKRGLFLLPILAVFFLSAFFSLNEKISRVGREAIVIVSETSANFEPFDRATAHFTLYEGMKVEVAAAREGWLKIKRPDIKTGWVKQEDLSVF